MQKHLAGLRGKRQAQQHHVTAEAGPYLYDPFQEPENWAETYSREGMFDICCGGYEAIPLEEWAANENVEPARIDVTFFPSEKAQSMSGEAMTLLELRDKIHNRTARSKGELPWLKLAKFSGERTEANCLRHDKGVTAISGIELDYDREELTLDAAIAVAEKAKLAALFYTSASYTEEKPRWRVLLPTSKELPPSERVKLVARVNGLFDGVFSPKSFVLSQSYYFGAVNKIRCIAPSW